MLVIAESYFRDGHRMRALATVNSTTLGWTSWQPYSYLIDYNSNVELHHSAIPIPLLKLWYLCRYCFGNTMPAPTTSLF